jgi:hypothetical protein
VARLVLRTRLVWHLALALLLTLWLLVPWLLVRLWT